MTEEPNAPAPTDHEPVTGADVPLEDPTDEEPVTGADVPLEDPTDEEPVTGADAPRDEPEPASTEASMTTKIVLIEGKQWSIPYDTPVEQVRENLAATYPGIRTATVTKGTIRIEGVLYETIAFTKQAGTKGHGPEAHPLLPLLDLPTIPLGLRRNHAWVGRLRRGLLSFEAALALPLFENEHPMLATGTRLCQLLDDLSAAAVGPALTVPGWSA